MLNYEEVVVYESHAILPEFVIVYKKNGVHKIANWIHDQFVLNFYIFNNFY